MNNKTRQLLAVSLVILFSAFIYIYKLSEIPSGFYVDEAAVSYNAVSIVETGRDIFGQKYPVLFRLLGSYTPSLYIYVSAVVIKLFGSQILVFRLISTFAAIASVVFFYITIKSMKLLKNNLALNTATFFYAISPWLVFNARLGYEVTLAYTLFNIGVYFLWKSLNDSRNLLWAMIFLSLSTYTAHTQRFLVPIFTGLYFLIFRKEIFQKKNIKNLKASFILVLVMQIPHFNLILTPAFWVKNERFLEQEASRRIFAIVGQFLSYLSLRNLFYKLTDIDKQHTIPGISVMYNFLVVPYLIGLYILAKMRKHPEAKFLLLLFISSLVPAALSGEFISIQRALPFLLPFSMVIGMGIDCIANRLKPLVFAVLLILFSSYALLSLFRSYFVLFPNERANAWNYGYEELSIFIKEKPDTDFVVDNSRNPRNYILLLYFLEYPTSKYQQEVDEKYKVGYYSSLPPENEYAFSNISVRPFMWESDPCKKQILIGDSLSISSEQAREHKLEKIYELKDPLGNVVFEGYQTNPDKKCSI